jgi:hypothetical protein
VRASHAPSTTKLLFGYALSGFLAESLHFE